MRSRFSSPRGIGRARRVAGKGAWRFPFLGAGAFVCFAVLALLLLGTQNCEAAAGFGKMPIGKPRPVSGGPSAPPAPPPPPIVPFFSMPFIPGKGNSLSNVAIVKSSDASAAGLPAGMSVIAQSIVITDVGNIVAATADLVLGPSGILLTATLLYSSPLDWKFTVTPSSSLLPIKIGGISVDPTKFTGTIVSSSGTIVFKLSFSSFSASLGKGLTISGGTLSTTNVCPFRDANDKTSPDSSLCPDNGDQQLYLVGVGLPAGSSSAIVTAAICITQPNWIKFLATTPLDSYQVGPYTLSQVQLNAWTGAQAKPFDSNLGLPDLVTDGTQINVEICGTFQISIPSFTTSQKVGCARLDPAGTGYAVLGQIGTLDGVGIGWTNIAAKPMASIRLWSNNVPLQTNIVVIGGTLVVPAKVLSMLGFTDQQTATITGAVSKSGLTVTASAIPYNIGFGSAPLVFQVTSVQTTLAITGSGSITPTVATSFQAITSGTFGWPPLSFDRDIVVNINFNPSDGTATADAGATGSTSESNDGLTPATKLQDASSATFVWNNAFGIPGLNLWYFSVSFQMSRNGRLSGSSMGMVAYLDPKGSGILSGTDWLYSTITYSKIPASACIAFGFDGTGTKTKVNIKNVLYSSKFLFGITDTGCTTELGPTLPPKFVGFSFSSTIGGASFDISLLLTSDGYYGKVAVKEVTIAGVYYPSVTLQVQVGIDSSGQVTDSTSVMFDGTMICEVGQFYSNVKLYRGTNDVSQHIKVTGADIVFKGSEFSIPEFGFEVDVDTPATGCATISSYFYGKVIMKSTTFSIDRAGIVLKCGKIQIFQLWITFSHYSAWNQATKSASLRIAYWTNTQFTKYNSHMEGDTVRGDDPTKISIAKGLIGVVDLSYSRHFSNKYKGRTFGEDITVGIWVSVGVYATCSDCSYQSLITAGGYFKADRVDGLVGCVFPSNADPTCGGKFNINPSWAGDYDYSWDMDC